MRILVLSSWFPYPADNGSKSRAWHLLRALAERHDVTLISFVHEGDSPDEAAVQSMCNLASVVPRKSFRSSEARALLGFLSRTPRSLVDTYSPEMAKQVRRQTKQSDFDILVALQMGTGIYAMEHYRPSVLDEFEIGIVRDGYRFAPNILSKFRHGLTWFKTCRYVRSVLHRFLACTVVSTPELEILSGISPEYRSACVVPNGIDVECRQPRLGMAQPNSLIYNGALTYYANYDAMRYFLQDIWPLVRAAVPSVSLQITGKSNGVQLNRLPIGTGVYLTGYLPDIRSAVAGAWVCVVPLRIGGGTRIKILEAMALGTPVVSTSKGAEGLDVTPEVNILLADDPVEFAAQTVRVLRDPSLRSRLVENARQLVEAKYDWSVIGRQFNQLIESVARSRNLP